MKLFFWVKGSIASIVRPRLRRLIGYCVYVNQFRELSRKSNADRFSLLWKDRYVCLDDKTNVTNFDRHYVYHPAWAARIIRDRNPDVHVDIGSSLFFIANISAFVPVRFYDYRPAELILDGLECDSADLKCLPFDDQSIGSLSCMHVVEHIGLGRYGDAIDPDGDIIAMKELQRVLVPGGDLLFVVPIGGVSKIIFNAHRIYSYEQIVEYFDGLVLHSYSLIPQFGPSGLVEGDAAVALTRQESYGCGCFWFKKSKSANAPSAYDA